MIIFKLLNSNMGSETLGYRYLVFDYQKWHLATAQNDMIQAGEPIAAALLSTNRWETRKEFN